MSVRAERAAVAASRRPERAPRPSAPDSRAPLRVVRPEDRKAARSARRRARMLAAAIIVIVGAGLFGVAALHVVLTQNQFRLDRIRQQAASEQSRYERLRLDVAQLESPQRIVDTAQQRLGMVTPPEVRYLTPPAGTAPARSTKSSPPTTSSRPTVPDATAPAGWAAVKPQLAPRP